MGMGMGMGMGVGMGVGVGMGRTLTGMVLGAAIARGAPALLPVPPLLAVPPLPAVPDVALAAGGLVLAITAGGVALLHLLTRGRVRFRRSRAPIASRGPIVAPRGPIIAAGAGRPARQAIRGDMLRLAGGHPPVRAR